ncbi:uncharacterized protein VTP21DRAFT_7715 [Calcarisporiella thermophila]|uniref:uncharacterized protein n=1 Tax=Calcarisporiella thermophila TaxID=911321 RepID=UPI003744ADA4
MRYPMFFCLKYAKSTSAVDYPEVFKKLDEVVREEGKKIKIIALCGEGGAGKSHAAVEFCYRVKEDYKFIFWMDASTETVLQNSFKKAAKSLGKGVKNYLQDNYFPKEGHGIILITTRQGKLGVNVISIDLDDLENQMDDTAALELLLRKEASAADYPAAISLVRDLEHLPLALDITGRYILYECNFSDAMAVNFIQTIALLHPETLPLDFLYDQIKTIFGNTSGDCFYVDNYTLKKYLDTTIEKFQSLSFITLSKSGSTTSDCSKEALRIQRLVQQIDHGPDKVDPRDFEIYIPHVQNLALQFERCMQDEKLKEANGYGGSFELGLLLSPTVKALTRKRQFKEAEELAKFALLNSKMVYGVGHIATAKAESDLFYLFSMKRDFVAACPHGEVALVTRKVFLSHNDRRTRSSLHYLAFVYTQIGKLEKEVEIYKEFARACEYTAMEALSFTYDHFLSHKEVDSWLHRWRGQQKKGIIFEYGRMDRTPLHQAIQDNDFDIINSLTDYFKEFANAPDKDGLTPIHYASIGGKIEIVNLVLKLGGSAEAVDKFMGTPMHSAAMKGHDEMVEFWARNKANVNARNKDGYTPLHCATKSEHIQDAKKLIENNADVNAKNDSGWTPLHFSTESCSEELMRLFLENGAEVDAKHFEDKTALHYAASKPNAPIVKLLVENGADVNIQDYKGRTPLHFATSKGNSEVVQLLLENGANLYVEDDVGYRPIEIAKVRGIYKINQKYVYESTDAFH